MRKKQRDAKKLVSDAATTSADLAFAKATTEAARWRRKYKDMAATATDMEKQVELLLGIQEMPALQQFVRPSKRRKSRGVAVVVPATDWHVEEQVTYETTSNKNIFNLTVAEARIKRFYEDKVPRLIDWQNHLAPVTELWHPLLGDLLSGHIHDDLMESNALSPTEASLFLQEMICSGINFWLKETKLPIFIPTCHGNHGRTTKDRRIKTAYKNSFEWLLYMTMAKHYADNPRVQWVVGKGYHNTQEIMGRKVRFHHGENLRYQGGVGGITIPVNKAVAAWDKIETVDFDIFGHWHTYLPHYPKWISCGSLMGYSEFSVSIKAEFQHPTQAFIVIDRNYGMTLALPIFLTKAAKK